MIAVWGILIFVGLYLGAYVAYCVFLHLAHFCIPRKSLPDLMPITKFAVVIPAHDEELLLPRLLESAQKQDYPPDLFNTIVIADNCIDKTAELARRNGAIALERFDDGKRGKGYAIEWALEAVNIDQFDAVLIIDADCVMSSSVLTVLDGAIQEKRVIQSYIGLSNPDDSWFTRLLDVSRAIENEVYRPAKQRLGLLSHLEGTGMCFTTEVLRKYGWDAFTVGEDWEYYAKLVLNNEAIGFAYDAKIYQRESSSLKQATSQRMRWSSGRFAITWKYGFGLLLRGLVERNLVKFDAALPLIFPNPSLGMNMTLIGLATSLAVRPVDHESVLVVWFLALCLIQTGIFVVGVFYTHNKLSKFMSIFIAPAFLIWKMGIDVLSALGMGRKTWTRTERKI